ncbi:MULTISPECIES: hypothetical protein [unclassified Caulobacter]|uniref:hypothetical protein n=1 Tax=unclassified Caulobacter TaxID=2648921 RepID=UPI000D34B92E|nr:MULTISPECIES: hypothetical protein [unclassified Caulobacter]PTS88940.1 hypothetical protein DBR21_08010 [Caulobacter sp. HMWF009]PTT08351.1 hypothetical protein DBR10_09405 [Caulobacter sp. HMWF025]
MTQTDIPTWCLNLQIKLMAALDAAWAVIESTDDPAAIARARQRAKAAGEMAAMVRKVALASPADRPALTRQVAAGLAATKAITDLKMTVTDATAPVAAQVEPARRALDRLKGGRRGRL